MLVQGTAVFFDTIISRYTGITASRRGLLLIELSQFKNKIAPLTDLAMLLKFECRLGLWALNATSLNQKRGGESKARSTLETSISKATLDRGVRCCGP